MVVDLSDLDGSARTHESGVGTEIPKIVYWLDPTHYIEVLSEPYSKALARLAAML